MANIVLTTLNAKYIHSAFGLRYLFANLGDLKGQALIQEFDIHQKSADIVELILIHKPKVVGIGVYIWNAELSADVVSTLKQVSPEVIVVIGGPEVSFEIEDQPIVKTADYVITGEADLAFAVLCRSLIEGGRPRQKVIQAAFPELSHIALPYEFYDDSDIRNRIIYVEASRGCPFTCEFCLSSLAVPVRQFSLETLLRQFQILLDRGVNRFKFVDRTFNLNIATSRQLLEFFHERYRPGMFLHFEMIPDRLPDSLRELISGFPAGSLQFEIGIQTLNEAVGARIKRRQNLSRTIENFRFLREQTGVHVHADLIVGLPGESIESFAHGFDQLVGWRPQEIQVGVLKRLRGTPISRHDAEFEMVYSKKATYEILRNREIDFQTMQRLRRFARYWDLVANSGNFLETAPRIWKGRNSPFWCFLEWSDWLYAQVGRSYGISLVRLAEFIFIYLSKCLNQSEAQVAQALCGDYRRGGRNDVPEFIRPWIPDGTALSGMNCNDNLPRRQARHTHSG